MQAELGGDAGANAGGNTEGAAPTPATTSGTRTTPAPATARRPLRSVPGSPRPPAGRSRRAGSTARRRLS